MARPITGAREGCASPGRSSRQSSREEEEIREEENQKSKADCLKSGKSKTGSHRLESKKPGRQNRFSQNPGGLRMRIVKIRVFPEKTGQASSAAAAAARKWYKLIDIRHCNRIRTLDRRNPFAM